MPQAVKPACRHRPAKQKAGGAAGLGSKLCTTGQPHPVIRRLVQPVIFDNHCCQPLGAQNILERGKAACRARCIDNQQPRRIDSQSREPGSIQHAGSPHGHCRTPDHRPFLACHQTAHQRRCKPGQRRIMPGAATQHMDPSQRQPAGKRRIKHINPQRQTRRIDIALKTRHIAAQLVKMRPAAIRQMPG